MRQVGVKLLGTHEAAIGDMVVERGCSGKLSNKVTGQENL